MAFGEIKPRLPASMLTAIVLLPLWRKRPGRDAGQVYMVQAEAFARGRVVSRTDGVAKELACVASVPLYYSKTGQLSFENPCYAKYSGISGKLDKVMPSRKG